MLRIRQTKRLIFFGVVVIKNNVLKPFVEAQ